MEIRKANESELQLLRMQQQVKDIAREKHKEVIGIEQTAGEEWVIVSKKEEGSTLQFMINDCTSPYQGTWDFALQVEYKDSIIYLSVISKENLAVVSVQFVWSI